MNEFITWEMLGDFVKLTSIVFTATQYTKNAPIIKKIPTKYWSWIVAFILITLTNINTNTFVLIDLALYGLSAMFISTSANGIYNAGDKEPNEVENKE